MPSRTSQIQQTWISMKRGQTISILWRMIDVSSRRSRNSQIFVSPFREDACVELANRSKPSQIMDNQDLSWNIWFQSPTRLHPCESLFIELAQLSRASRIFGASASLRKGYFRTTWEELSLTLGFFTRPPIQEYLKRVDVQRRSENGWKFHPPQNSEKSEQQYQRCILKFR